VIAFDDFGRAPLCFHRGSYAMLFNHPETFAKAGQERAGEAENGRMGNHAFFLMLRAVRAYQERYQPKLETLGLSLIEARILLVLNDIAKLTPEALVEYLHAPITEAQAALGNLTDRGFVSGDAQGYGLSEAGRLKATQCWAVAEAHAAETFGTFDAAQIETFTDVLRALIKS
jgi:DNA-binding MarR family transcriptional regulator